MRGLENAVDDVMSRDEFEKNHRYLHDAEDERCVRVGWVVVENGAHTMLVTKE